MDVVLNTGVSASAAVMGIIVCASPDAVRYLTAMLLNEGSIPVSWASRVSIEGNDDDEYLEYSSSLP